MDENIIDFQGDHIHVVARGNNTAAKSLVMFRRIVDACQQHDCYNIIGEAETKEEMSTLEAFKHIEVFTEAGMTWKHRLAWVAADPDKYEQLKFVETVLRNRALLNGQVFRTLEQARSWLFGEPSAATLTSGKAAEAG
ncbi:hypothetical protein [Blastopirellula retiformator]|nr:hypothetical protein [Blastopirellula retiformator]